MDCRWKWLNADNRWIGGSNLPAGGMFPLELKDLDDTRFEQLAPEHEPPWLSAGA